MTSGAPQGSTAVPRTGEGLVAVQAGGEEGARVSIPEDLAPDELTTEKVRELLAERDGLRLWCPSQYSAHETRGYAGPRGKFARFHPGSFSKGHWARRWSAPRHPEQLQFGWRWPTPT